MAVGFGGITRLYLTKHKSQRKEKRQEKNLGWKWCDNSRQVCMIDLQQVEKNLQGLTVSDCLLYFKT